MSEGKFTSAFGLPYVGQIVLYQVSGDDPEPLQHNHADVLPAIVTAVFSEICVNLKVLCDGPGNEWKRSVMLGDEPGQWQFIVQNQYTTYAWSGSSANVFAGWVGDYEGSGNDLVDV